MIQQPESKPRTCPSSRYQVLDPQLEIHTISKLLLLFGKLAWMIYIRTLLERYWQIGLECLFDATTAFCAGVSALRGGRAVI